MDIWADRDERQAARSCGVRARHDDAQVPTPTSAYIDVGVIGFVFGEMWRRGVLTARDRRWITLSCLGFTGSTFPIETHVWAALNSGDIDPEEFDEFGPALRNTTGLAEGVHLASTARRLRRPSSPTSGGRRPRRSRLRRRRTRRARGTPHTGRCGVRGRAWPTSAGGGDPLRRSAYLDYLYGEIWTAGRSPDQKGSKDHQHLLLRLGGCRVGDPGPP